MLLELHERRGDDAMYGIRAGERDECSRKFTHQTDGAAAVNEGHGVFMKSTSK